MGGWILRRPEKMEDRSIVRMMSVVEKHNIDLKVVDPTKIHVFCDTAFDGKIYVGDEALDVPDYVIAAFFTEKNYHTKAALKMLGSLGVICINSYECIQNVDDKLLTLQKVFELNQNIRFPKTLLLTKEITAAFVSKHFTYPVVLKVMHGSGGTGVVLVHTEKELDNHINITTASSPEDEIIIQEYVASSKGRDLRLIICNGKYDRAFIRENPNSFRSNTHGGGSITPYTVPEFLAKAGEAVAAVMDIRMGSVDFMFGEADTFYFCEANAMIGLAFDPEKEFLHLLEQVKNRPEPAWKKRLREKITK